MLSPAAFAAPSDNTVLNGTIPAVFNVVWTADPTTAFTMSAEGVATGVSLGTVTADGNVPFTVKASSPTAGNLVGKTDDTATIAYTVTLAAPGSGLAVTPLAFPGTAVTTTINPPATLGASLLTLDANTTHTGTLSPQIYEDTLTLTTSAP
jgi:hypothetical protein